MRVRARAHTPTCAYHPSVCRQAPSEREREKNENANVRALATFFTHTFLVTRHSFLATIRQTWAALPKTSATFTIAEPKRKAGGRAVRSSCCRWTRSTMSWTVRGKKQASFFFRSHLAKQQPLSLVLSRFPRFTYTPYTHTHTHTDTHAHRCSECGRPVRGTGQLEPGNRGRRFVFLPPPRASLNPDPSHHHLSILCPSFPGPEPPPVPARHPRGPVSCRTLLRYLRVGGPFARPLFPVLVQPSHPPFLISLHPMLPLPSRPPPPPTCTAPHPASSRSTSSPWPPSKG